MNDFWKKHCDLILKRELPEGGFAVQAGGHYRPDATAWAILAFRAARLYPGAVSRAQNRLVQDQQSDGRVVFSSDLSDSFWPTPLAVLAWQGSPQHEPQKSLAVDFLIKTKGRHFINPKNSALDHNTALQGWPWTEDTHSWIEPTALSVLALTLVGQGRHPRVREAVAMIVDRQLPSGGWNYGNRKVFGQELYPLPDQTGIALSALVGQVSEGRIASSLPYLAKTVKRLNTPFSLSWGLLGLSAWGRTPEEKNELLKKCLNFQNRYGPYETAAYGILLCSYFASAGLLQLMACDEHSLSVVDER
jgi:hypothetical protein